MKNNLMKIAALKVVEKTAKLEVKKTNSNWQAVCAGFLHQPRRPE